MAFIWKGSNCIYPSPKYRVLNENDKSRWSPEVQNAIVDHTDQNDWLKWKIKGMVFVNTVKCMEVLSDNTIMIDLDIQKD
ncbi:hypothetical protein FKM82_015569 [Ascaphus truei]